MSTRPPARRSSLAGASPAMPVDAHPAPVGARGLASVVTAEDTDAQQERPKVKKVSFYQAVDESERMRAALMQTHHVEGSRTLSEFIARAVLAEVERLERQYNDGKPWQPVAAGQLPQGRPLRG